MLVFLILLPGCSTEDPAADDGETGESDLVDTSQNDATAEPETVQVDTHAPDVEPPDVEEPDDGGVDILEDAHHSADVPGAGPDAGPDVEPDTAAWQVLDGVIYHDGAPARIRGVNWFGMETPDHAPHGLWTGRTIADFVGQAAELGFNALRLPVTPGSIRPGFDTADWAKNAGYATGREALEAVLTEAQSAGLFVLLDYHSCNDDHGAEQVGDPTGCDGATIAQWHADLQTLAELGLTYTNVLGIDLFNEPHGLTWPAWLELVDGAAAAIHETNPDLLIFVQGVANLSDNAGYTAFWGGNLSEAGDLPPTLPGNRLVFSPHVYGPSVASMPYFNDEDYPTNLIKIWQAHFGYLHSAGFAVITGEFGSRYDATEVPGSVAWQDAWVTFMVQTGQTDFFYWALNANTGEITGILEDDWETPAAHILAALKPLLEALVHGSD
ncbi:MAG: endoglucanase [Myxococcota bacterium]|jgi:endoglucanase